MGRASDQEDSPAASRFDGRQLHTLTPREVAEWQLEQLQRAIEQGKPGSIAHIKAVTEVPTAHEAYTAARDEGSGNPEDLSEEEWAAKVKAWAEDAPLDDVERVVAVWLRREKRAIQQRGDLLVLVHTAG